MLEVRNLSKSFVTEAGKIVAVDDVSFTVNDGEIYGLIGLSGAGKSTLIRCLNVLERADSGEIILDGCDLLKISERELERKRRKIGMIFQSFNLFGQRTVEKNVAFPIRELNGRKISKEEIEKRVSELLAFVDLKDKAKAYPSELSGGQRQRVAIARALAMEPSLLLSDEGTSALDPETSQAILDLIKKIVQERGISVVLITHQMEVARSICDRIAVMEGGKIVEENDVEAIFLKPKHPRTRAFIRTLQDEFADISTANLSDGSDGSEHEKLVETTLYRLAFVGEAVYVPFMSRLAKNFDLEVNLLEGNINRLHENSVGFLIVSLDGEENKKLEAIEWLRNKGIEVEKIR